MLSPASVPVLDRELLEAPAVRRRVAVIVNPHAAGVEAPLRNLVIAALRSRYDVEPLDTTGPRHAIVLAREAVQRGAEGVITLGGDGTVNEAANGLAGTGIPLIPLPAGSQNVFPKMLGMPSDLVDATEHVLALADRWEPRQIDLGRVEGRVFTFCAGAGLDASVVERVDANPDRKRRWRERYYAWEAASLFLRRYLVHPPRIAVATPAGDVDGITVLVQNGDPYTFAGSRPIRVARDIALDSGTISAAVLCRATPIDLPAIALRLLSDGREVTDHKHVAALPGLSELRIRTATDRPFHVQVDGDLLGEFSSARFDVLPGALTVLG